jgi:hypothetical protein
MLDVKERCAWNENPKNPQIKGFALCGDLMLHGRSDVARTDGRSAI